MSNFRLLVVSLGILAFAAVSGCANTIRGAGQDASNAVDATGDAVDNIVDG